MNAPLVPPHSIEAEMCAVGSMFYGKKAIAHVVAVADAEDFYRPAHQKVFHAIVELHNNGSSVDLVTVKNLLIQQGELEFCGGVQYLTEIMMSVPSAANALDYALIVRDFAEQRQLETAAHELIMDVHDPDISTADARCRAALALRPKHTASGFSRFGSLEASRPTLGVKSLYPAVNQSSCGGWPGGQTCVVAGHHKGGKTSTMLADFLYQMSAGRTALYASFGDLSDHELEDRFMKILTKFAQRPSDTTLALDWDRSKADFQLMFNGHCYHAPQRGRQGGRVDVFADSVRAYNYDHPLDIVYCDYAQIIKAPSKGTRVEEQEDVSEALCDLARELGIPIIVGSQLTVDDSGVPSTKYSRSWLEDSAMTLWVEWKSKDRAAKDVWRVVRPDEGKFGRLRLSHGRFNKAANQDVEWDEDRLSWIVSGLPRQIWDPDIEAG